MRRSVEVRAALVGAIVIAIVASAPPPAEAQGPPAVKAGTRVWVTTADGREQEGAVESISPTQVVLRIDAASRSIALADVRRIEGRDPLGNGIRNGGIVGAAAFGGFGVFLSQALCESSGSCLGNDLDSIAMMAGLGAGIGMASGALIDYAIRGRRLLYSSPNSAIVFQVTPHLTARSVGARASLTWPRQATARGGP